VPHEALTQIGKYRVFQLVGEGAMGIVYRAQDTVLARTVALKVMTDAIARDEDLRERFLREAQAAGSLQHPNVVTIYDFGETDGHLYIAMEFVEGVDLETVLEERQPLTLDARLGVVVDLLTGLAYAHKRGIVHRDVKPANIRLTDDGRAKIMDFGIVHLTSSNMTRTGMMMGTPSYMAPEQVTGAAVTPATDIFAAGVVLYELLTGAKPFDAPTLHSILFKIVSEEPRDVLTIVPSLPAALSRIVNRALSKDPGARYASALEMANELSVVRAGASGGKDSGTLSLRASLDARRNSTRRELAQHHARRVAQWAGGALAAGAAAATIWMAVASRRSTEAAEVAPAQSALATRATGAAPTTTSLGAPAVAVLPSSTPGSRQVGTRTAGQSATKDAAKGVAQMVTPPAPPPPATPQRGTEAVDRNATTGAARTALPAPPQVSTQRVTLTQPGATPTTIAAPPVVAPSAASNSAANTSPAASAATSSANATAGVQDAIAAYAHAIQSRDVSAIRRVYPDISSAQQNGFQQFFDASRALRVSFSLASLDVSGNSADARVVGTYDYTGADGRPMRQPVSFRAALRQDGGAWRLISVQ
jgi:serine/threonine-protein kinase